MVKFYDCSCCNYTCSKKSHYDSHLLTLKHNRMVNGNIKIVQEFKCECNKKYTNRHSLSRHKSKCNFKSKEEVIQESVKFEPTITMFMELIKKNQELQDLLIEQHKQNTELVNKFVDKDFVTNNTTNNNSHNTTNNNQKFNSL